MGSLVIVLVLVLDLISSENEDDDENEEEADRATGTDAATGNDRDYTCEVELTIGEGKGEATIQTGPRSCLLVPRIIVHRTEPIKLLDLDVVGAGALQLEGGRSRHLLLSLLSLQALLIFIELGLFPIIDAVLLRGWIDVIQLPFILYGRDFPDGQSFHMLLLRWGGHGHGMETGFLEQAFFLRRGGGGCAGAGASRDKSQGRDGTQNTR